MATVMAGEAATDANGLVGDNSPTSPTTIYPDFIAENQRGAFIPMVAAILVGNDADVYKGWRALAVTYGEQNTDGSFGVSPPSQCTGSQCMRFFMAESNHALAVLMTSPYVSITVPDGSGLTYAQEVNNLLPKLKLALDYMMSLATQNTQDSLYGDFGSPNRAMSDGNAFAFSYYMLLNYAPAASSLASYESEAQWWINCVFVQSAFYTYRPLANTTTGVFYEGNGDNGFGYDSNYAAVATDQAMRQGYYFPAQLSAANVSASNFMMLAGRWMQQRIYYPIDPLGLDTVPFVDDTDDTRTGPTGYAEAGKSEDFAVLDAQMAMLFYTALYNRPEGVLSVSGDGGSSEPGAYGLIVNRPPVIFNDPTTLTLLINKGTAMSPYNAYATNTGIQNGTTQTLDPAFSISAAGLPPGISLSGPYTYPSSLQLDSDIGYYTLTGTPTQPGTYSVILTPTNRNGTGATVTLTITVGPVPTLTFKVSTHNYGDAAFNLSANSNSTAPINYAVISGPVSLSGSTLTITGAGTATVQAVQTATSNYAGAVTTATFQISPAMLNITLNGSPSRIFGAANPSFTTSITGFVYADTQASATAGSASITTTAVPRSPAGTYPVTVSQGTLSATNYTFTFIGGTLTVMGGAAQTIFFLPLANFTPGAAVPVIAQATSGLPVTLTVTSGPASLSGNMLTVTGSGAVTITASQPGNSDFAAASSVSQTFTAP